MTSFKQNYSGEGWNDCMPNVFANAKRSVSGGKRTYPKTIVSLSNIPPPLAKNNTTITTVPIPPPTVSRPSLPSKVDSFTSIYSVETINTVSSLDSEIVSDNHLDTLDVNHNNNSISEEYRQSASKLLEVLLSKPSVLSDREFGHYKKRLTKEIPSLEDSTHLSIITQSLELVEQGDISNARDILVQHSLVYNGISSWVLPLRKVIESVQL